FVMDTDFTGVRVDSQYSFFQHENSARTSVLAALDAPNRRFGYPTGNVADGGTWHANLAIGAPFDDGRGHVLAYAGYRHTHQIAPSGNFGNTLNINCDNPLMSAQERAIVCAPGNLLAADGLSVNANRGPGAPVPPPAVFIDPTTGTPYNRAVLQPLRRNVEGGGRRDDLQHTSYRIVAGMRGDLDDVWSYDMYYQFGQTNFAETYSNDFSVRRLGL